MKIRPGIDLLAEITGYGPPIRQGDHFEAVYKYYRNRGDPILFETTWHKPIPTLVEVDGAPAIGWLPSQPVRSHITYEHRGWLERRSGLIIGLYYALLGMQTMGYRKVKLAPPFFSDALTGVAGIPKGSITVVEIFLIAISPPPSTPDAPQAPAPGPAATP